MQFADLRFKFSRRPDGPCMYRAGAVLLFLLLLTTCVRIGYPTSKPTLRCNSWYLIHLAPADLSQASLLNCILPRSMHSARSFATILFCYSVEPHEMHLVLSNIIPPPRCNHRSSYPAIAPLYAIFDEYKRILSVHVVHVVVISRRDRCFVARCGRGANLVLLLGASGRLCFNCLLPKIDPSSIVVHVQSEKQGKI